MNKLNVKIGDVVTIPAGAKVTRQGEVTKRSEPTKVTVRHVEKTRAGNFKVTWKSNGYMATTVLKA